MIDDLAEIIKGAALREFRQAMRDVGAEELTAFEVVALLTVLRQARTRVESEKPNRLRSTLLRNRKQPAARV